MRKKWVFYSVTIILILVVVLYIGARQDLGTYFPNVDKLSNSKFFSWVPDDFPKVAKNIRIWADVETNQMGMTFELPDENQYEFDKYKIGNVTQRGKDFFLHKQTVLKKLKILFTQPKHTIACYITLDNELYLVEKVSTINYSVYYNLVYFSSQYWDNILDICFISADKSDTL